MQHPKTPDQQAPDDRSGDHRSGTGSGEGSGTSPEVLVGIDGSSRSLVALRWALHWAHAHGGSVQVLAGHPTMASMAWLTAGVVLDLSVLDAVREDTWVWSRAAVDQVLEEDPALQEVRCSLHVQAGPAAELLVERSAGVDLLVVGTRGRGAVASAALGSVALHCVSSAACPVVVVPEPGGWADPCGGTVVVAGVDGSPRSAVAVAWALEEAGARGHVRAVRAYGVADLWYDRYAGSAPTPEQRAAAEAAELEKVLGALLQDTPGAQADVARISVGGDAGPALVQQARDADLLVVASRGRGEFRGLLLGSVALYCVLHAPCPVLVVRSTTRTWAPGRTWRRADAAT